MEKRWLVAVIVAVAIVVAWLVSGPRSTVIEDVRPVDPPAAVEADRVPLATPPRPLAGESGATTPTLARPPEIEPSASGGYEVDVRVIDIVRSMPVGLVPVGLVEVTGVGNKWAPTSSHGAVTMHGRSPFVVVGTTDLDGRVRIRVDEASAEAIHSFGLGRDWMVVRWHRPGEPENRTIDPSAGAVTRIVIEARRAFWLRGVVVDSNGVAIPASVSHDRVTREGSTATIDDGLGPVDRHGGFGVGPFAERAAGMRNGDLLATPGVVRVRADGYATTRIDAYSVPPSDRDRVRVVMTQGVTLAGIVVDEFGRPVPDAVLAIEYGDQHALRRGTRTDAEGRWRVGRLTLGDATVVVRAFARDAKARREVVLERDDLDLRIVAEPIRLSKSPETTVVLGLSLVEVDDEIRAAYDVAKEVKVLIFDAGDEPHALGIGRLEKGFGLWIVGEDPVTSVRDAVEKLLLESRTANDSMPGRKRVVYTFWNEDMSGTNTQHVSMTPERRAELEGLRVALAR